MKSGTLSHIKVKRLKRALGIPLWQAVGLLETLWQMASDCADDGDITRYSSEDIACYFEWDGDADALLSAMVSSGWIDLSETGQMTIHDWEDHCPNYIKDRVRKRKQRTCDENSRTSVGHSGAIPTASGTVPGQSQLTQPNPTNPNPVQPNQVCADESAKPEKPPKRKPVTVDDVPIPTELDTPAVRASIVEWLAHKRSKHQSYASGESFAKILGTFARDGPAAFVEAVNFSIGQNYDGIHERKKGKSNGLKTGPGQRHDPSAKQLDPNDF